MALTSIDVKQLRNIEHAKLNFSSGLNLIVGPNASGKTSLLEAIGLVCQGRSFRTARIDQLIRHDQDELIVVAEMQCGQKPSRIGLSRGKRKTTVKMDGRLLSTATELASFIPFFVLRPESHELLDSGPQMRRQYLDWGVFHVKPQYIEVWKKYHRILRQRNISLRRQLAKNEVQAWDHSLVENATLLHQFRAEYINRLSPFLADYGHKLIGEAPSFDYHPGWGIDKEAPSLAQQLLDGYESDSERGYTRLGPHRADIKIKIHGKPVQNIYSRGQQKLLICAMTLAQLQQHPENGILLVDDLPAELDPQKRQTLLELLSDINVQVFVTATEQTLVDISAWPERKVFHVKHGSFQDVI